MYTVIVFRQSLSQESYNFDELLKATVLATGAIRLNEPRLAYLLIDLQNRPSEGCEGSAACLVLAKKDVANPYAVGQKENNPETRMFLIPLHDVFGSVKALQVDSCIPTPVLHFAES